MEFQKLQVFEKLKQLREWQQQQQQDLLKQQENELKTLKKEQDAIRKRLGLDTRSDDSPIPKVLNDIVSVDTGSRGKGSLQPHGHTASGSSIVSNHSSEDSGMLSGHSSSTDVDKPLEKAEHDNSSGFNTPTSEILTDDDAHCVQMYPQDYRHDKPNQSPYGDNRPSATRGDDERPIKPGIGHGSANTFEELLKNKLEQYQGDTKLHPAYIKPPSSSCVPRPTSSQCLLRCGSEDSFVVRKEEREQVEEAELAEFELLEQVAQESSFSSQCSLVLRMVGNTGTHLASSPKAVTSEERDKKSLSLSPVSQQLVSHSDAATHHDDASNMINLQPILGEQCLQSGVVPSRGPLASVAEDSDEDLNSSPDCTLQREQGSDFDDNEVWDSFIGGTPSHQMPSSNDNTPVASPQVYHPVNSQPAAHTSSTTTSSVVHQLHHQQSPISTSQKHPSAVRKVCVIPDHKVSPPQNISCSTSSGPTSSSGNLTALPPPSALVAKLFPSLHNEKTVPVHKVVVSQQQPSQHHSTNACACAHNATSETPTKQGNPATYLDGLDEQVRVKLMQLEGEIERFKTENINLEKLRNEREKALSQLKEELHEFEKQKEQEVYEFEQYKQEETRKLKKERKVFENYQREVHTAREKKDKDELIALKHELDDVRDDLRQKEARWSSTLSRYRLRIESLEAQNEELQSDLRTMEEQRLLWWQQQLERKNIQHVKPGKTSLSPTSRPQPLGESKDPTNTEVGGVELEEHKPAKVSKLRRKSDSPRYSKVTGQKENKRPGSRTQSSSPIVLRTSKTSKSILKDSNIPKKPSRNSVSQSKSKGNVKKLQPQLKHAVANPNEYGSHPVIDGGEQSPSSHDENEPEIIEVRAVDKVVKGEGSEEEVSDEADDIVSQVLGGETKHIKPTVERHLVSEDISSRLPNKCVRFDIESCSDNSSTVQAKDELVNKTSQHSQANDYVQEDGSTVVHFPNGTKKVSMPDGQSSIVYFFNGDTKRTESDGTIVYFYSTCSTTHKTYSDGTEVLEFSNGQSETHRPDGSKEIRFPDGTVRYMFSSNEEKVVFGDGVIQYVSSNGDKTINFPDGQREMHTQLYKRREYPDGTIKTLYPDGRQETLYSNGRLRVKNAEGEVIIDKINKPISVTS